MNRLASLMAVLPASVIAIGTLAASQQPYHVRGTITAIEGDRLTVTTDTDDGESIEVRLGPDAELFVVTPARLEQIEAGQFVGVTSIASRGRQVALEVHIFDEKLRGVAEGHRAWDLVSEPNTMTHATIAEIKRTDSNRQLRLTYKQGGEAQERSQEVVVPAFADVVHFSPTDDRSLVEPDRSVFLVVEDDGTGMLKASAAVLGTQGAAPPM